MNQFPHAPEYLVGVIAQFHKNSRRYSGDNDTDDNLFDNDTDNKLSQVSLLPAINQSPVSLTTEIKPCLGFSLIP
jgi:hypothetical protein